jgi:hypothetical protein
MAPTLVEVPFPGLTPGANVEVFSGLTPTNAAPSTVNSLEGANDNAPELNVTHCSAITVDSVHDESHCSAITADSVRETQPHLIPLDVGPTGNDPHATPVLAMEWCSVPPAINPRVCSTKNMQSCVTPPCVASAVVDESSCCSYSSNTNNPVEHRLSAVILRDAAGSLGESGPSGPVPKVPTTDGGMGPRGGPPIETGHRCHAEHDGTGRSAGPAMLLGPHGSLPGTVPNTDGGLSPSKTASGMALTSGELDEHGKCIVPRSSHRDGGCASGDYPGPASQMTGQGDQIPYGATLESGPEANRVGHAQAPIAQTTLIHDPSGRAGRLLDVLIGHEQWDPSGRAARLQDVIDQGPSPLDELKLHAIPERLMTNRNEACPWRSFGREEGASFARLSSSRNVDEI